MIDAYKIFKDCFTDIGIGYEQFCSLFSNCDVIYANDEGVALVKDNMIRLLAVRPEFRNNGVGTELLYECELLIKKNGYDSVVLGGSPMCGAVNGSDVFFIKHGYIKDGDFVEMGMDITSYSAPEFFLPDGVCFKYYDGTLEELHRAVADVDEEWVQYFSDMNSVFCGYLDGKLASFCIIGEDELCLLSDDTASVGSVGCVGTIPSFRNKGIGLAMVSKATELLRDNGSTKCFIHYTHLEKWYAKLGYMTFLRFSPMSKKI